MRRLIESVAFQPPDRRACQQFFENGSCSEFFRVDSCERSISGLHFHCDDAFPVTVLWSHGNAEDLSTSYFGFQRLHRDMRVRDFVVYDYTGYGCSSDGTPSEASAFHDVTAVYEYLVNVRRIPPAEILIGGRSLGSGPATYIAAKHAEQVCGLILVSPLSSACSAVGKHLATMLRWVDIFRNDARMEQLKGKAPVLIVHGTSDTVVPFENGKRLYERLTAPLPEPSNKRPNFGFMSCFSTSPTSNRAENQHESSRFRTTPLPPIEFVPVGGAGHNDIETVLGTRFYTTLQQFAKTAARWKVGADSAGVKDSVQAAAPKRQANV